ncbi:electron transporter RnfD [Labilibacter sediminis]|nr:electron transporter RnfD [Labilibacter sediminis]
MNQSILNISLAFLITTNLFLTGCGGSKKVITPSINKNDSIVLDYKHSALKFSGRIDFSSNTSADLIWSGSSIKINFEGESVSALLNDHKDKNYYNLILDNDSIILFNPGIEKQYYTLVSELDEGAHTLEIFKRNEWGSGPTSFYEFKIVGNAKLLPTTPIKKRKIEFYGNSITAGYGNEDLTGDRPDSTFTNNYKSYAAITARHYNAEYSCIAKGGIGVMISWFDFTMPDIYDRFDPKDDSNLWDFSLYTPDVVVVNLFQNDSWLVKKVNSAGFKAKFGDTAPSKEFIMKAYKDFISELRTKYPNADIICALGSMDATKEGSPWPGYIQVATKQLNDPRIYTHFFPYKDTKGHPKEHEHRVMAKSLIKFIDENIEW